MNPLLVRVVAGVVGLGVVVPALVFGGELAVEIIVPIAGLICLDEYARMAFPDDRLPAFAWLIFGSGLGYGVHLYAGTSWVPLAVGGVMISTAIWVVLRPGEAIARSADRLGRYLTGMMWIGGFLSFLPLLRRFDEGIAWVFLALLICWGSDTGAYFSGRFLGRHKLYERISPKKTWEGFFGGLATSVGVAFLFRIWLTELTVADALVIGIGFGSASALGDLTESLLKRAFAVKDSGWIMPGHGGLLDRVDSVLFVAPLLYGYAVLIKGH